MHRVRSISVMNMASALKAQTDIYIYGSKAAVSLLADKDANK